MAGELNFKAVFDYGDAKKSVDELFDIFEKGQMKMNEAFNLGRTVEANRKQLRDMISITRQTLKELETVYDSTMKEIKEAGGLAYVSEEEREYVEKLGDGIKSVRAQIRGLQENLKEQNFNKNIFAGLTQGLQGLMGAYTAARGVMVQFGASEDDLVKVQTKLQASMSILMGVQQLYNALQSTSAFRIQITAKATELLTAAETKLAAASGIAKVALGGLVVVLAAAVGALAAFATRHEKSLELSKEFADQVVSGATQQVLAYRKLQAQWAQANGDLEKQRKIVASDDWKKLGIAVNNINDAEKVLVDNSDAVVRAMMARAKSAAYLAEAQNDIAKAVRNENKAENAENGKYTTGQLIRGTLSSWMPGLMGARYVQQGFVNGEWVDTEANKPGARGDYQSRADYRNAWIKFIAESDAAGYRDLAKQATEGAMEKIRSSAEYEELENEILRSLGLLNGPNGPSVNNLPAIIEKQRVELARLAKDIQFETTQARINAMEEGTARTIEQINLDYEKEKEAILRASDELIDAKIARDKELWEADPKNKGKVFTYNRSDYGLTQEEYNLFEARNLANDANRANSLQSVFDKYLTFTEQFNKAAKGFNGDITALKNAGASIETIGVASKKAEENFVALAKAWVDSGWDDGLVEMTILLNDLELQLQVLEETFPDEELEILRAQIKALKDAMKQSQTEVKNEETNWTDLNKVLVDSASLFDQIGEAIGGEIGEGVRLAGQFASALAKIQVGIKAFNKEGVSGVEKFSAGISIASAALSVISSVVSKIRESVERTRELNEAATQYEITLQRIKDSKALNSLVDIFGTDFYSQFSTNFDIAEDAKNKIDELIQQLSFGTREKWDGRILYSNMNTWWDNFWESTKNIIAKDFDEFFDENGNLLGEELKEWFSLYGEGVIESNKKILEEIIAEWDRWQEALDNIKGYLSDLFNNITGQLANKMLDNFLATGNAIVDMTEYINDFSKAMAKSIIQSKLLRQVFDENAQNSIATLIAKGDIAGAIELYNSLLNQANELAPNINEWLKGINIQDTVQSQNATAGGFQVMSQDAANELNGRFAALQIAGENILLESRGIHTDTSDMAVSVEEMRNLSLISMGYLEDIERNTHVLPDMAERLEKIEKYSKQMVS